MANTISTLPYDIKSATSIFEYSKGLLGNTLRDFVWENYTPKKGKGSLGQMVENIYFLLETNNYAGADFSEAGMELKCTPLKKSKQDEYLIKERLSCNMINYCEVVNEDFEHSTHLDATKHLHNTQEFLIQCTMNHCETNSLYQETVYLSNHKETNALRIKCHPKLYGTHVRCQGHFSEIQASARS